MQQFIQVILPLKIDFEPFYKINRKVSIGDRLSVKFAGRQYIAVVSSTEAVPDIDASRILPAGYPENPLPPITEKELQLWRFIAGYYMCTAGEVYKAAYPEIKTSGEAARAKAAKQEKERDKREKEHLDGMMSRLLDRLQKKEEQIAGKHSEKVYCRLKEERDRILTDIEDLKSKMSECRCDDKTQDETATEPVAHTKNKDAKRTLEITATGKPVLITGISDRDEIIAECVKETLAGGKNCLVLVPEIKTSESLLRRLNRKCRGRLVIFNSSRTMGDRRNAASMLRDTKSSMVYVGTRSSLFLPYDRLGLVVVDSEESPSHKSESTPRINARDTAAVLAKLHGAGLILSSACPSLETEYNVKTGKFEAFSLPGNEGVTTVIDTVAERRKNGMTGHFALKLLIEINKQIRSGNKCLILHPWEGNILQEELSLHAKTISTSPLLRIAKLNDIKAEELKDYALIAVLEADRVVRPDSYRRDERARQVIHSLKSRFSGHLILQASGTGMNYLKTGSDSVELLLKERKSFNLPPYTREIEIVIKDHSENRMKYISSCLLQGLEPWKPLPGKSSGSENEGFCKSWCLYLPKGNSQELSRKTIKTVITELEKNKKYTGHITIDVDPV